MTSPELDTPGEVNRQGGPGGASSSGSAPRPTRRVTVQLTEHGYLHFSAELAQEYFPSNLAAPVPRGRELWLFPTRGAGGGGLILKQRNAAGDRSVLIWEHLPAETPAGPLPAFWDDNHGALRIALPASADAAGEAD